MLELLRNNVTRTHLHLLCSLLCEKNCFVVVGVHKSHTVKFYTLVPNILSRIIAVPPPLHPKICIRSHVLSRKCQVTVMFTSHTRIVGPHYGACCMLPVCHQEYRGGSYSLGKVVHPCSLCYFTVHSAVMEHTAL
jgi:hypothetical protein